jgi:TolA-binding protein
MIRFLGLYLLVASLTPAFAVDKNILELEREVGLLAEQVKQLQQSQDRQLTVLQTLVQQSLDASHQAGRDIAGIQSGFQQSGTQLKNEVVAPVVSLGTRMDQVTSSVTTLQTAVSDLTSTLNRIQAQITDLGNAVKVLSTPAPPPPNQSMPGGGGNGGGSAATDGGSSVPPVNASDLYNSASTDRLSGKVEFALQEYNSYLKYFGNTNLAASAQYYIGSLHFSEHNYEAATADFDTVLEKYPDNALSAQAHLYKGKSLFALGKRQPAVTEFQYVINHYPSSDTAGQACNDLKEMGMHCPTPTKPIAKRKD